MGTQVSSIYGASSAMTITLASLASSTSGVGRQSTLVSNISASEGAMIVRVYYKITTGTSPTVNTPILLYLLQGDAASPNITTDNAGASDAGLTVVNAPLVAVIQVTATSNQTYEGSFIVRNPGPLWGLAVVNSTGVNLNATGGNHAIRYVTESIST